MKKNLFLIPVAAAAAALWLVFAAGQLQVGQSREGRQQLEDAIRRTAAACYAAEGFYPPTLEYMKTHYGLQVREDRYLVFYEVFAENLMPEITVLEK